MPNEDREATASTNKLARDNQSLRGVLRELIALKPSDQPGLIALQGQAQALITGMDGRSQAAGFSRPEVRAKAFEAQHGERVTRFRERYGKLLLELRQTMSLEQVAIELNRRNVPTPSGEGTWNRSKVHFQIEQLPPP